MPEQPTISPYRWISFALLAAGAIALCIVISNRQNAETEEEPEQTPPPAGVYAADIQPGEKVKTLMECLILLSVEELARMPEADGFQWPCGTAGGAMTYDAQAFGVQNELRDGQHSGMDLNGIGGEDTDVGMPVRAAGRGMVVYCGTPSPQWGNVVVLAHRLPGSTRVIQTLYAHLDKIGVSHGQMVARGQEIGTIGTAGGHYLGHLHFEAVESRCVEAGGIAYHKAGTMNRMNPAQLIADHPAPPIPDAYETIRRIRIRENYAAENADPQEAAPLPPDTIPVTPSTLITQ